MESRKRPLWLQPNLQIIFAITLIAVMGVTSVTPVLPVMREIFNITPSQVALLITAFTLPGVFLSPVLGVLADRFGRKTIILPSLLVFAIAGTACAFTRDFGWLVFYRFIQGTGSAAIGVLNITLIGDLYSGKERASAMGYNAGVLSVGTAAYPALGGALALLGWHYPFYLSLLALPVGLLILFGLKNPEPGERQAFGLYLRTVFHTLKSPTVIGLLTLTCLSFIMLYGPVMTFLPILMHDRFSAEPYEIGLILSCSSVLTGLTATQLGRLSDKFSFRKLLIWVNVLYVAAMVIATLVSSKWWMLLPSAIYGTAQGITVPGLQTLLAGSAPLEYRAAFMSANGSVLRLGQTLGPVIMGIIFTAMGMNAVFYAGAGIALLMSVIVFIWIGSNVGRRA
jgi:MFS family permease